MKSDSPSVLSCNVFKLMLFTILSLVNSPTPTVKWIRLDALMLAKNEETSFGQELTVHNVVFEDGGEYQCVATNMVRGEEVTKDFHLNVECKCCILVIYPKTILTVL